MLKPKTTSENILQRLHKTKQIIKDEFIAKSHEIKIKIDPSRIALSLFFNPIRPTQAEHELKTENDLYDQMEKGWLPVRINVPHA